MGQSQSSTKTPLQCLLDNFKDFKARVRGYGAPVGPGTLQTLCELDWSTFGVDWPPEGSFNLQLAFQVRQKIHGDPGHPDQIPHIDTWIDIATDRPGTLKNVNVQKLRRTGTWCS